jgi:hypothetical protein
MPTIGRTVITAFAVLFLTLAASPAAAQVSLAGDWASLFHEDQPERAPGPELGDYLGLPISDAARRYADAWDSGRLTIPEHQCRAHVAPYILRGPAGGVRIWEEKDPTTQAVVAIKMFINTYAQTRTFWMDGRPHPSESAPLTWQGFSTGQWEGNQLVVTTTHVKQGWVRRNGLPMSPKAVHTERFIRHGDRLVHTGFLQDPVYLAEPLVKTEDFVRLTNVAPNLYQNWLSCQPDEEIDREKGVVPHYLPGTNPNLQEFASRHRLPFEATRGGPETMYPEYMDKLRKMTPAPPLNRSRSSQ